MAYFDLFPYAPIVALAVSLQRPASPRMLRHINRQYAVLPPSDPENLATVGVRVFSSRNDKSPGSFGGGCRLGIADGDPQRRPLGIGNRLVRLDPPEDLPDDAFVVAAAAPSRMGTLPLVCGWGVGGWGVRRCRTGGAVGLSERCIVRTTVSYVIVTLSFLVTTTSYGIMTVSS